MYTDRTSIENVLGRTLTDREFAYFDATLNAAIQKYIDEKTETTFGKSDPTIIYASGDGTNILVLPTVHDITEVKHGDDTIEDYQESPRHGDERFCLVANSWEKGVENYAISATLGYKEIPADIKAVATEIAVNYFSGLQATTEGYKSEKVGDWSATYLNGEQALSERSMDTLADYIRLTRRI